MKGVITQQLVPLADGTGRIIATEVMVANAAICNLIRENKTIQIPSQIQAGKKEGMHTLNESLVDLVHRYKITREDALSVSNSPSSIENMI